MHDIDIYNNSMEVLKKKEEKIYIKFIIIFLLLCVFLSVIIFIKYPKEYHFEGFVQNNNVFVYLKKENLDKLKGDVIKIKDEEFMYKIDNISELDYDINYERYYLVRLVTNYNLIENDVIKFNISDGTTNLYNEFFKRIWKGFE